MQELVPGELPIERKQMSGSEEMLGPIDYLIVEWPAGSPPNGEAFPHLVDLVDRGLIRILDFSFVEKDDAGNVLEIDIADFDGDGTNDLLVFAEASSGLLDEEDYCRSRRGPGTRGCRCDPRLREHLGGAVRHCVAEERGSIGRLRAYPGQRIDRHPRRARSRRGLITKGKRTWD